MSESKDEKRSVAPHRGFRFFFWVSATLFFLAGANWLFNLYIAISGSISYLAGLGVLLFAILLVAGLLNFAYTFIPNIRVILNGVLGLDKEPESEAISPLEGKKGTRTTYVELVKKDSRITVEDIGLLFNSEMDHYGSFWLFFVGLAIGLLTTILNLVVVVGTGPVQSALVYLSYFTIASVVAIIAFATGFWLVLPRFGKDPTTVREKRFNEYLDAKDAIAERNKKKNGGENS